LDSDFGSGEVSGIARKQGLRGAFLANWDFGFPWFVIPFWPGFGMARPRDERQRDLLKPALDH
jgi:hypothetical protein